jgi:hypothetical protein
MSVALIFVGFAFGCCVLKKKNSKPFFPSFPLILFPKA